MIKIRYKNSEFATLGNQDRFYFENYKEDKPFEEIKEFAISRTKEFSVDYDFNWDDLQEIEFSFRKLLYLENKPSKISNKYKEDFDRADFKDLSKQFSVFNTSIDEHIKVLDIEINDNNITNIKIDLTDRSINFIDKLNTYYKVSTKENRNYIFHKINKNLDNSTFGMKYISNNNYIIIKTEKENDYITHKTAFTKEGRFITELTDTLLEKGVLKRSW